MNIKIDANHLRTAISPYTHRKPDNQKARVKDIRHSFRSTWSNIKCLSRSVRIFLFDMVLVEGKEKHSGRPVKTLFVGETKKPAFGPGKFYLKSEAAEKYANFQFIINNIYSDYSIIAQKNVNGLSINRWLRKHETQADMVFIDAELFFARRLDRFQYLAIPQWVPLKLILADQWEDVIKSFRKNLRKKLKNVLKQGYQFCVAHTDNHFNYFYHAMYVPYTQTRFGKAAVIYPQDYLKKILKQGELLFLIQNDRILLGSLNKYDNDSLLVLFRIGAEDLQPEMFKGASEIMDYVCIISAFEKGFRLIDWMGNRPLMNDGGFRYKRKWGTFIDKFYRPLADIYFKILNLNAGVRSFLAHNPFIIKTPNGFRGRILLNAPAGDKEIKDCAKWYKTNGLEGIDIFCTTGIRDDIHRYVDDYAHDIKVYDISNSPYPERDLCIN